MVEKVIGLLQKMNLSATEKKGIRLGGAVIGSQRGDPQAVGKVMVEKTCERSSISNNLVKITWYILSYSKLLFYLASEKKMCLQQVAILV
jgi:hypothetical protein